MTYADPVFPDHISPALGMCAAAFNSTMTAPEIVTGDDVYAPQSDSHLLVEQIAALPDGLAGRRVLDFCTGSGVIALAAAHYGAESVTAVDISPSAVLCAQRNANAAEASVDVILGSLPDALAAGPYDVVLCNPPYVPAPEIAVGPVVSGPTQAWDASTDGRLVLDPLCAEMPQLLTLDGTFLLVHSEFSGIAQTLVALRDTGLKAMVIATRTVPFGPVMASRARWMEQQGIIAPGCREERLVVIRATRR